MNTQEKITKISSAKSDTKTLLLDFDRTLICGKVNGVEVPSITSILRSENHLDQDYSDRAHALFDHYHAIEKDPSVGHIEKSKQMHEWWTKHFELKIEKSLNINHIKQAVQSKLLVFRFGVKEMLEKANMGGVQVIILSANGLGYDSIKLLLERDGLMFPNIQIISNQVIWNQAGTMISYIEPIIHSGNKYDFMTADMVRENVILAGDGLHDADMLKDSDENTKEEDKKTILRFGIYENSNTSPSSSNLEKYQQAFDIVMMNDEIDFKKVAEMI